MKVLKKWRFGHPFAFLCVCVVELYMKWCHIVESVNTEEGCRYSWNFSIFEGVFSLYELCLALASTL